MDLIGFQELKLPEWIWWVVISSLVVATFDRYWYRLKAAGYPVWRILRYLWFKFRGQIPSAIEIREWADDSQTVMQPNGGARAEINAIEVELVLTPRVSRTRLGNMDLLLTDSGKPWKLTTGLRFPMELTERTLLRARFAPTDPEEIKPLRDVISISEITKRTDLVHELPRLRIELDYRYHDIGLSHSYMTQGDELLVDKRAYFSQRVVNAIRRGIFKISVWRIRWNGLKYRMKKKFGKSP